MFGMGKYIKYSSLPLTHLDDVLGRVDLLEAGDAVGPSLAGPVLSSGENIPELRVHLCLIFISINA